MTRRLVRWRLALRIARRDALRHRARTVLVLAMVGLPVLAVVAADTLFRTSEVTPVEALPETLGSADAVIDGVSREPVTADPVTGVTDGPEPRPADPPWTDAQVAAALPGGSRVVPAVTGRISYRTGAGRASVAGHARDLTDAVFDAATEVRAGRAPSADGEIAISDAVARRGIGVGDVLALTDQDLPATVVGIVRAAGAGQGAFVVLPPEAEGLLEDATTRYFAEVPGGLDRRAVRELNRLGLAVVSRDVVLDPPSDSSASRGGDAAATAVTALVVAAIVLEVVLLAGPAFAVGLRRQRYDLALIAAAGGAPDDLRRVVLAGGVVLGGGAAVLGAGLGVALARAAVPLLTRWRDVRFGPFDVAAADVLLVVAVGVLAGLAAAAAPAAQAARTDVVDTLTGRRGQVRSSWRLPVAGLVLAVAGLVLVVGGAQGAELGVAAGAVLLILGTVTAAPWLIGLLAPLGRWLPTAGRLAVRDAIRHRGRTAPAVAAVMATVAGVTALAIGSASDSAEARRDYVASAPMGTAIVLGELNGSSWEDVESALRAGEPDRAVRRIQGIAWSPDQTRALSVVAADCAGPVPECRWSPADVVSSGPGEVLVDSTMTVVSAPLGEIVVADADALRALDTGEVPAAALAAVEGGRAAVFGPGAVDDDGHVGLAGVEYGAAGEPTVLGTVRLPAVEVALPAGVDVRLPALVVVPPALGDRLPIAVRTTAMVAGGPEDPVTPAQEERVRELLAPLDAGGISVERGWQDELAVPRLLLMLVGGFLVLVATLTATGLALADARPDLATLASVGAAPGTRRRLAMGSAAVVGGPGALLGVLVGLAPGIAVAYPLTSSGYGGPGAGPVVVVPWGLLAVVAVAVPLIAVLGTGIAVRSRLPMSRRLT